MMSIFPKIEIAEPRTAAQPRTAGRPRPRRVTASRKGSAILIVLGMLSFMVVSAVGFAVYMRQSRLPSSYLRRSASSRYLLKAALANAIARLDGCEGKNGQGQSRWEGVYDDPYPGIGPKTQSANGSSHSDDGDFWVSRVFTPFGQVDPDTTVSTLTLEGLAYLPPAILNEARVYSRLTRTAQWKNLSYDSGRYAFSAFDVSDCFDVNKVMANVRRSSAAGQRVNLSSLFDNNASQLDNILKQVSRNPDLGGSKNNIPFVSLADFNVVAQGSEFAPFARYVKSGSNPSIYSKGDFASVSNALFVTDTWFPPTNVSGVVRFDLERGGENQPFKSFTESATIIEPSNKGTLGRLGRDYLQKNLNAVGMACLYDYLDEDSVPISYAIPTLETAAMVTGVGFADGGMFKPMAGMVDNDKKTGNYPDPKDPENARIQWTAVPCKLTQLHDRMVVYGSAAFPFKRAKAKGYKTNFTPEFHVKIFMGVPELSDKSRIPDGSPLSIKEQSNWENSGGLKDGVYSYKLQSSPIDFSSDIQTTRETSKRFTAGINKGTCDALLFWKVTQTHETKDDEGKWVADGDYGTPYISFEGCRGNDALAPYNRDGEIEPWWTQVATRAATFQAGDNQKPPENHSQNVPQTEYRAHVYVWVKMAGAGGKIVDVVPATVLDDKIWGDKNPPNINSLKSRYGADAPVLAFHGQESFAYNESLVDKFAAGPMTFGWSKLFTVDPRFNFAPENWLAVPGGNGQIADEEWLTVIGAENGGGVLGSGGRDPDVFLFTSDQEYLQSINELAFLPYLQDLDGSATGFSGTYMGGIAYDGSSMANRLMATAPNDNATLNSKFGAGRFFWRTYRPWEDDLAHLSGDGGDCEIVSGEKSFRVNPFSPDTRVLMAALKGTPYDWAVASTNDATTISPLDFDATPQQAQRYTFAESSSLAKMADEDLLDLASEMRAKFSQQAYSGRFDWERAYDSLAWENGAKTGDNQLALFGVDNLESPLHMVDRKFLYGFWRECFQNRQQLFLVFLRAEPLTVGGSGSGALGTQLGARGVALVWRDPAPPTRGQRPARTSLTSPSAWKQYYEQCAPHRTRVLFYHQFD